MYLTPLKGNTIKLDTTYEWTLLGRDNQNALHVFETKQVVNIVFARHAHILSLLDSSDCLSFLLCLALALAPALCDFYN